VRAILENGRVNVKPIGAQIESGREFCRIDSITDRRTRASQGIAEYEKSLAAQAVNQQSGESNVPPAPSGKGSMG